MTLHEFIWLQIEEMERHKWIESQKAGRDLGEEACFDWVNRHAEGFRRYVQQERKESIVFPDGSAAPRRQPVGLMQYPP